MFTGPAHWADIAPSALGLRQSPVIIHPRETVYDKRLGTEALKIIYPPVENALLTNNGHSVQVNVQSKDARMSLFTVHFVSFLRLLSGSCSSQ